MNRVFGWFLVKFALAFAFGYFVVPHIVHFFFSKE